MIFSTRFRCRGSSLRPGMLAPRLAGRLLSGCLGGIRRRGQRLALALGFNLFARYARLQIQQFELKIAQRLAALAVPLDALLAKTLFQHADLQLRVIQFAALRCELLLLLFNLISPLIQLRLKLRDELNKNSIGVRLGRGLWRRTHDASLIADRVVDMY